MIPHDHLPPLPEVYRGYRTRMPGQRAFRGIVSAPARRHLAAVALRRRDAALRARSRRRDA